jgi:U6 snRNA-associated Sm-like protein LSm8
MHIHSLAQGVSNQCEESVTILTCDGRLLVGTLIGHDQVQNLILNDAQERIYSEDEDVELVPLGLYVIRGDNVAIVGDATWSETDLLRSEPLPTVKQHSV